LDRPKKRNRGSALQRRPLQAQTCCVGDFLLFSINNGIKLRLQRRLIFAMDAKRLVGIVHLFELDGLHH